jgi:hypothetical protein
MLNHHLTCSSTHQPLSGAAATIHSGELAFMGEVTGSLPGPASPMGFLVQVWLGCGDAAKTLRRQVLQQ